MACFRPKAKAQLAAETSQKVLHQSTMMQGHLSAGAPGTTPGLLFFLKPSHWQSFLVGLRWWVRWIILKNEATPPDWAKPLLCVTRTHC